MYIHILILWIKLFQLFRKFVLNATSNNSFGLGLTAVNELCKSFFIIENKISLFKQCLYYILGVLLIFHILYNLLILSMYTNLYVIYFQAFYILSNSLILSNLQESSLKICLKEIITIYRIQSVLMVSSM